MMLATLWKTVKTRLRAIGCRGARRCRQLADRHARDRDRRRRRDRGAAAGDRIGRQADRQPARRIALAVRWRMLTARLRDERGSSLVETLLALGLRRARRRDRRAGLRLRCRHARSRRPPPRTAPAPPSPPERAAGLERSRQVLDAGGGAGAQSHGLDQRATGRRHRDRRRQRARRVPALADPAPIQTSATLPAGAVPGRRAGRAMSRTATLRRRLESERGRGDRLGADAARRAC